MLKLNYTDVGLYMERTVTNPELLIAQRVLLTMRLGQTLHVEPGRAAFLIPADLPQLEVLEVVLQRECAPAATLTPVDQDFMEVGLTGSWIAEDKDAHEGILLVAMSDGTEFLIYKLWQMSEARISALA